jgi:hypothetical protein
MALFFCSVSRVVDKVPGVCSCDEIIADACLFRQKSSSVLNAGIVDSLLELVLVFILLEALRWRESFDLGLLLPKLTNFAMLFKADARAE